MWKQNDGEEMKVENFMGKHHPGGKTYSNWLWEIKLMGGTNKANKVGSNILKLRTKYK